MAKITIVRGDITKQEVDVVVNAANRMLVAGGGVDGAIHAAAGPELQTECLALGGCRVGEAKITESYALLARYVIHTVGPVWRGGESGKDADLASCYRSALALAVEHGLRTVAFPSISTGAYGYPVGKAARVVHETVRQFLDENDGIDEVVFVCFEQEDYVCHQAAA